MGQEMRASLVTITPEMAKEMLKKNIKNRPVNRQHLEFLTQEIKQGRFVVNGDTICMNCDRLIDGQKRLMAVVAAGMPITTWLIEGVDASAFVTKDIGQRRSLGDTLSLEGETNAKLLAGTLCWIDRYITGRVFDKNTYTNTDILGLLQKYPDARKSLSGCHHTKHLIPRSLLAACHYLFSQKHPELAEWFVSTLISGQGMTEGQPIYVLRERLMRNCLAKAKISTPYIMALTIKAWNAEFYGKKIACLRFRESGDTPEDFPVIA